MIRVEIDGNLAADPELRFTPNGAAVANFTIMNNTTFETGGETKEKTVAIACTAWREMAENVSESLSKGDRVIGWGSLENADAWSGRDDGQPRAKNVVTVRRIGADLGFATAQITRNQRNNNSAPASSGYNNTPQNPPQNAPAPNNGGNNAWGNTVDDDDPWG